MYLLWPEQHDDSGNKKVSDEYEGKGGGHEAASIPSWREITTTKLR